MPRIRQATVKDLPRILVLYQQLNLDGHAASPKDSNTYARLFHRIERDKAQRLVVLEDKGEVVGTVVIIIVPNLSHYGRPWCELENLVVEAKAKRRGYGRMLMAYAERLAQKAGCYKIQLMSRWSRAEEAHKFYEALGYESPARAFRKYLRS
ncbi:MAG: GNAT family N-acetyltransferase [Chloroflexi bacterium]|nr:GNAT family N-acetyltransferase [Chloroflexota bacterium]